VPLRVFELPAHNSEETVLLFARRPWAASLWQDDFPHYPGLAFKHHDSAYS